MRISRVFVVAAGLVISGPALAQEAKKPPRAAEAERVGQFLEQHAKADPAWAAKQCQLCHVVPEKARALIVSRPREETSPVRVVKPHYFEYEENDFQPNEVHVFSILSLDPSSQAIDGLTVAPVDVSLRQQLKIPDHQGLVVTSVDTSSPSHTAGVFLHDVLLKVDDKPIGSSKDLVDALRGADGKSLSLTVMRHGKSQVVRLKPRLKIILEPAGDETPDFPKYWIGVSVGPIEPALRSQLNIADSRGLSVVGVHPGSPADKAEVKRGDILLTVDDQPLTDALSLRRLVDAAGERQLAVKSVRGGLLREITLTPVPYKPEPSAAITLEKGARSLEPLKMVGVIPPLDQKMVFTHDGNGISRLYQNGLTWRVPAMPMGPAAAPDLTNRLNALDAEMREVRSSLQKIEQALGKLGAVK